MYLLMSSLSYKCKQGVFFYLFSKVRLLQFTGRSLTICVAICPPLLSLGWQSVQCFCINHSLPLKGTCKKRVPSTVSSSKTDCSSCLKTWFFHQRKQKSFTALVSHMTCLCQDDQEKSRNSQRHECGFLFLIFKYPYESRD